MTAKDLKNALLQEAVQGKLVPQIASEGNARDLLEEIRKERGESLPLALARKRSSATPSAGSNAARNARFAPITEDEIPFEIPENWCWCKLGDIAEVSSSKRIYANEQTTTGVPFLRVSDLVAKINGIEKNDLYISEEHYMSFKKNGLVPKPNDVLITSRGTLGLCYIIKENDKFYFQDGMITWLSLPTNILPKYLCILFDSNFMQTLINEKSNGTAVSYISIADIKKITFPLPPLAEQKRIVAAIEKFMPLIEEYGKKETELKAFNEQICTLTKKAILQEAVQGKLVPQIAAEGNAKDLLEEINKEKTKLIKEGKIKKEKPLPEISEDEIPFDIPENWCWCRLGEIVNKLTDGTHRTPKYVEKGIPFLSVKNLSSGKMDFDNTKFITPEEHKELYARCNPEKGDMLLTKVGTTGIPVINDSDIEFSLFVSVALIKFNHNLLDEMFFLYLLQSPLVQDQAKENTRGVGNKNWVMEAIANTILVLPPLLEQKRIVEAIEKMLPLCEQL